MFAAFRVKAPELLSVAEPTGSKLQKLDFLLLSVAELVTWKLTSLNPMFIIFLLFSLVELVGLRLTSSKRCFFIFTTLSSRAGLLEASRVGWIVANQVKTPDFNYTM